MREFASAAKEKQAVDIAFHKALNESALLLRGEASVIVKQCRDRGNNAVKQWGSHHQDSCAKGHKVRAGQRVLRHPCESV